jgi:hypothetical protein
MSSNIARHSTIVHHTVTVILCLTHRVVVEVVVEVGSGATDDGEG